MAETYPDKSKTFRKNSSTEVLEKEERRCGKESGKVLIRKKKREESQTEELDGD